MSDACAEWFLNKDNNSFETIINWQTQEDFEKTITTLRQERKIKDDDTSLIRINISETENPSLNNQIICEPQK
ncbi:MAG: hypothetical protein ORN85_09795 [Sediminibacterium sp.]|nr:hypothetical protein [Sediminibacterium sp.]